MTSESFSVLHSLSMDSILAMLIVVDGAGFDYAEVVVASVLTPRD